ncbi:MAG TPA: hypothetical protein V6C65_41605 [Allocoleopsis sp.]
MISNDNVASSNQSDQICEIKTTETIGHDPLDCSITQYSAMMPPSSDGLVVLIAATATVLTAIGGMCKGLADLVWALRGDDRDGDE